MCECEICKKEFLEDKEINRIRVNEDRGYMQTSKGMDICHKCFEENLIETEKGDFITIDGYLYYSKGYSSWSLLRSKDEIDYIFNKDYYDVLNKFRELNDKREEKYSRYR